MFALSSLTGCAATCCAACACEACRSVASGISVSKKSARLTYCGLFLLSMILAWVLRDYASAIVESIPWLATLGFTLSKEWTGSEAVLRITLANFSFFTLFSLIMIGVTSERDIRHSWHHEGWMLKFILWFALVVASLFIPNSIIAFYGGASRFGSGLFLLIQMLLLLDFTYAWNESWVQKDEESWYMALLAVTSVCFLASLIISIVLFHFFTPSGQDCELNTFFISFTLVLCVAMAVIALHPEINGSLFPASAVGTYCAYLCWSALSSEPQSYVCNGLAPHLETVSNATLAMGCLTAFISLVYSALRAGSSASALSAPDSPTSRSGTRREPLLTMSRGEESGDDDCNEDKPVQYSYAFFHVIFALASMYAAMLLTGWGNSGIEGSEKIDVGWTSVWVKIACQWVTVLLYIWSLVAPVVLPEREFN